MNHNHVLQELPKKPLSCIFICLNDRCSNQSCGDLSSKYQCEKCKKCFCCHQCSDVCLCLQSQNSSNQHYPHSNHQDSYRLDQAQPQRHNPLYEQPCNNALDLEKDTPSKGPDAIAGAVLASIQKMGFKFKSPQKIILKQISKLATQIMAKSAGKMGAKKIPVAGMVVGLGLCVWRIVKGEMVSKKNNISKFTFQQKQKPHTHKYI